MYISLTDKNRLYFSPIPRPSTAPFNNPAQLTGNICSLNGPPPAPRILSPPPGDRPSATRCFQLAVCPLHPPHRRRRRRRAKPTLKTEHRNEKSREAALRASERLHPTRLTRPRLIPPFLSCARHENRHFAYLTPHCATFEAVLRLPRCANPRLYIAKPTETKFYFRYSSSEFSGTEIAVFVSCAAFRLLKKADLR